MLRKRSTAMSTAPATVCTVIKALLTYLLHGRCADSKILDILEGGV